MALRLNPITAQLGKFSITKPSTVGSLSRWAHTKRRKDEPVPPSFESGHGEKIYIFRHLLDGMTVYSHSPVIKANRALQQIPFNGKKLKPSKIRKDYWRPLAMIQFPEGQGAVGRSVFLRMRECKKLHEYSWDDSLLYDELTNKTLNKRERGKRLNNQLPNTIADMAAVLGGLGKGNKIVIKEAAVKGAEPTAQSLVPASIYWADESDRGYAETWSENVAHHLLSEALLVPTERLTNREAKEAAAEELKAEPI
ncbi:hypothetical protein GGR57DRAFT_496304 [Xylariaceae sp. FL1272]|nr:hypothetical protein GGR57DRAFT_496304 [Xylariaceae sp. FL1272]